jgi:hypothetical protein
LNEVKYKLKVPSPSIDEPSANFASGGDEIPTDNSTPAFGDTNQDVESDPFGGDAEGDDKPFDDEPFDAGVEADEDSDPKKFIEQLSGKLGTSLRKYTETEGQPDFELEKFAVNSVISATHTSDMDEEDQKEIIKKVKTAGRGDDNVDAGSEEDLGDELPDAEPEGGEESPEDVLGINPDDEVEEDIVIEYEENIAENLPIGENFSTFVENLIMDKINKATFLTETVDEVFGILSADPEVDSPVETPVKEPDTKTDRPETMPTRRNKPWRVPRIKENPDPKANA